MCIQILFVCVCVCVCVCTYKYICTYCKQFIVNEYAQNNLNHVGWCVLKHWIQQIVMIHIHAHSLPYTTLQQTATDCNRLQHTVEPAPHFRVPEQTPRPAPHCNTLHLAAPYCNTLQHTVAPATHYMVAKLSRLHDRACYFPQTSPQFLGSFVPNSWAHLRKMICTIIWRVKSALPPYNALYCVAVCCSVLQGDESASPPRSVLQCAAGCCSVLQGNESALPPCNGL